MPVPPHWGYVLKGRVRIQHAEYEQVVRSGEIFYVEPGHAPCFEEDTQMVEFSPKEHDGDDQQKLYRSLTKAHI